MTITRDQLDQAIEKHEVPTIADVFPLNHFGRGREGTVYLNEHGQLAMEAERTSKWIERDALTWAVPE